MLSSPGRYFVLLLLGATLAVPLRSEETPPAKLASGGRQPPGKETRGLKPAVEENGGLTPAARPIPIDRKKLDLSGLPADAVLIVCEHAHEALELVPKAVILRPDKYQELLEKIEKLTKKKESPTLPTRCLLRGKVGSGAVHLQAELAGTAEHDNTLVSLACPQAVLSSAQTDGRLALIRHLGSGDYLVQIEKAGAYRVQLDLMVPLTSRQGNDQGFELTLPHPVITQLELDLPANSKDIRVGGSSLDEPRLRGLKWNNNHHLSGNPSLGPVDKLNLSWKEIRNATGDPVRRAEGRIQVRLDAVGQTSEAELLLKVEGAPTDVWRLLLPLQAEIKVLPPDEARVKTPIETANQKFASLHTIHLKEPSADPLHLQIKVPLTPRQGRLMPIGPFLVLDAVRQTGTMVVRNPLRNLHLDYHVHDGTRLRRRQTEESNGETAGTVATFEYSNVPRVDKPKAASESNALSWLDVEAQPIHPQVRIRVSHTLRLRIDDRRDAGPTRKRDRRDAGPTRKRDRRDAGPTKRYWEIATTITPANKWGDIDRLKVFVPPEWSSRDENMAVVADSNPPYVAISSLQLREAATQPLRLTGRFEGRYPAEHRAVLTLPRPQGILEACEVKIEAPANAEVVLNNAEQTDLELSKPSRPNEQSWRCRGVLGDELGLEVSWRPYRPELRAMSVADLTLKGGHGDIRHEIQLRFPATPPSTLDLRVPPAVRDSLQIEGENAGEWHAVSVGPDGMAHLPIAANAGRTQWRRVLHYRTHLGETDPGERAGAPFTVPLVVPEQATAGDITARVWSEPGLVPRPAAGTHHWVERGIEEVEGRDLPLLVLHTAKLDAPLRLLLSEQAAGYSCLVDRALVRVQLVESGAQIWRASFQLRQLTQGNLDILFPSPVNLLRARFLFNNQQVTPEFLNDKGEPNAGGNVARLRLPAIGQAGKADFRQAALLEVVFQSPPGHNGRSPLQTILQPPHIRGAPSVPIHWQVSVPANRVLIAPESASEVERAWTWNGWLPAPRLQRTAADLQREFDQSLAEELRSDAKQLENQARTVPAVVFWQEHPAAVVLTHAPRQAWLLTCSLGVLIVGLGLYWAARSQIGERRAAAWFWPLLALLTLAAILGALFWPTALSAVVYGCEPGLLVLLAVMGLQWLMQRRYRRQIVFLPSFSRDRSGSSLIHKNASNRPPSGEPSTVDAPPPSAG